MNDIRNGWENIDEFTGIPGYGIKSMDKFIRGRSVSIFGKIRKIFKVDFIFKSVGAFFIILNLILYRDYQDILIINAALLGLLVVFTILGIKYYKLFTESADPGKTSKENLSSMLSFLKRKFPIAAAMLATTYIFGYVPGILLYFMVAYGYLKPFTPLSYFVYAFILFVGILFGYILNMRQVKFHINHIRLCLSDLNDDALAIISEQIESKRKMDSGIIILIQVVILLGLIVLIAILKSILT
jgi:hypothetical protein